MQGFQWKIWLAKVLSDLAVNSSIALRKTQRTAFTYSCPRGKAQLVLSKVWGDRNVALVLSVRRKSLLWSYASGNTVENF